MTKTRLYKIWDMMRQRCNNPNDNAYSRYGGRGITICEEWNSFILFHDWAITHGYDKKLSIDRINNCGNYEPSNCRWATMREQANNKSNNIILSHNGETLTVAEWARKTGINKDTLYKRINVYGWPTDKALSQTTRSWTQKIRKEQ